jgi:hypothetical protein
MTKTFDSPASNTRLQKRRVILSETSNEEDRSVDAMQEEAFNESVESGASSVEDSGAPATHTAVEHCIARNRLPRGNVHVPVVLCCHKFILCFNFFLSLT